VYTNKTLIIKISVLWYVILFSLVASYQFSVECATCLQGRGVKHCVEQPPYWGSTMWDLRLSWQWPWKLLSSILKMEVADISKTIYQTSRRYIPEENNLNSLSSTKHNIYEIYHTSICHMDQNLLPFCISWNPTSHRLYLLTSLHNLLQTKLFHLATSNHFILHDIQIAMVLCNTLKRKTPTKYYVRPCVCIYNIH
jgi:hypothetical protein